MKHKLYPNLFSKGMIGNIQVKNRIAKMSMGTYLNDNGYVTRDNLLSAAEVADGGFGLVFVECAQPEHDYHAGLCIADDTYVPGLTKLAEIVHDHGAIAGIELAHPGRDAQVAGGSNVVAPSRVTFEMWYDFGFKLPQELTVEQIKTIIQHYGEAAQRAQRCGFDIVEIHACCGTLPCNFLNPHDNRRNDIYGGPTIQNRMRFLLEVVRSIKQHCGPAYPVCVKLSAEDLEPGGIKINETIQVAMALEKEGAAMLDIVVGSHAVGHADGFWPHDEVPNYAAQIKAAVNIPIMVGGSVNSPELAEDILASGKADFIGTARQTLADPQWPKKAKECRSEDIQNCILCMVGCFDKGLIQDHKIRCAANPTLYMYDEERYPKAAAPKKVAVVGGGPAGLTAALTAAQCGHKVTIYEKRELGGTLLEASRADFKKDIRPMIARLVRGVEKSGIEVIHEEATAETIKAGGYEAAVIAVGGATRILNVPGADGDNVAYVKDFIYTNMKPSGETAVVIGGGISGAEAAIELANQGKHVTIVEVMDQFLAGMDQVIPDYIGNVMMRGVKVITGHHLSAVKNGTVEIMDRFGNTKEIPGEFVVISAGFAPQLQLANQLEEETDIEVFTAGDCKRARHIQDATHEGFAVGRRI
jgi:2,4-dienoyl-CoA reductase (NADPH2)